MLKDGSFVTYQVRTVSAVRTFWQKAWTIGNNCVTLRQENKTDGDGKDQLYIK
jgi:hypothetical protein